MTLTHWVRTGEITVIGIVAIIYVVAMIDLIRGLINGKARTRIELRITVGRGIRQVSILTFLLGALYGLIVNWDQDVTARSVFWIIGAWCAFLAWTILDRSRWEL
jgi:uncharacterized membrane protein (GlpM family)